MLTITLLITHIGRFMWQVIGVDRQRRVADREVAAPQEQPDEPAHPSSSQSPQFIKSIKRTGDNDSWPQTLLLNTSAQCDDTPGRQIIKEQQAYSRDIEEKITTTSFIGRESAPTLTMASVQDVDEALQELSVYSAPSAQDNPDVWPELDDGEWSVSKSRSRRRGGNAAAAAAAAAAAEKPSVSAAAASASEDEAITGITAEMRSTNNFPFLIHDATINYVKKSQVMFVMRGSPGSGKSTIVKLLKEIYPTAVSCSADDFFLQPDGTYRFCQGGLTDAHETCQTKARNACSSGQSVIIIDNTNVRMWEMTKYVQMAADHGYTVVTVEPRTAWCKNARELAKRNKHSVTEEIIRKKLLSWEAGIPLYYGWFLNNTDSQRVMTLGDKCFKMLLKNCPAFRTLISEMNTTDCSEPSLHHIYGREGSSSTHRLHCTAFFSNRGRTSTSKAYSTQPHVMDAMGRIYKLHIIGFVFTPRTVGARVLLTPDKQLPLWGKDDTEGMDASRHRGRVGQSPRGRSDSPNWRQTRTPSARITDSPVMGTTAACSASHNYGNQTDTSSATSKYRPVVGEGSRAHLTLGYTAKSKAVQTGFDLQEVVAIETTLNSEDDDAGSDIIHVSGASVRCYKDTFYVVYLDQPITVSTLFSGRY